MFGLGRRKMVALRSRDGSEIVLNTADVSAARYDPADGVVDVQVGAASYRFHGMTPLDWANLKKRLGV